MYEQLTVAIKDRRLYLLLLSSLNYISIWVLLIIYAIVSADLIGIFAALLYVIFEFGIYVVYYVAKYIEIIQQRRIDYIDSHDSEQYLYTMSVSIFGSVFNLISAIFFISVWIDHQQSPKYTALLVSLTIAFAIKIPLQWIMCCFVFTDTNSRSRSITSE